MNNPTQADVQAMVARLRDAANLTPYVGPHQDFVAAADMLEALAAHTWRTDMENAPRDDATEVTSQVAQMDAINVQIGDIWAEMNRPNPPTEKAE